MGHSWILTVEMPVVPPGTKERFCLELPRKQKIAPTVAFMEKVKNCQQLGLPTRENILVPVGQ